MLPQHLLEFIIGFDIVEQLGHNEVCASLSLLDQGWQIELRILMLWVALIRMTLRIRSDANAKVVSILFPDIFDQVNCPRKVLVRVLLRWCPFISILIAPWRITPQRQDIPYAQHLGLFKRVVDELTVHVCACKM
jgi:hypothetical protein